MNLFTKTKTKNSQNNFKNPLVIQSSYLSDVFNGLNISETIIVIGWLINLI